MLADPYRISLLPGVQVRKTGDLAIHDLGVGALFEFADGLHTAVGSEQTFPVQGIFSR